MLGSLIYYLMQKKSQIIYFGKDNNNDNLQPVLSMDNGKKIPYVPI